MKNDISKENILKKIREGLKTSQFKDDFISDYKNDEIFNTSEKSLVEIFGEELNKINGEFYYCENEEELIKNLQKLNTEKSLAKLFSPDKDLSIFLEKSGISYISEFVDSENINSALSACEFLVARFGSVTVSSAQAGSRKIFSFPPIHLVIAYESQLVLELDDAIDGVFKKYENNLPSQITNITGPSRTADIEKTLILGAHGPKELIVLLLKGK
ncbi:MAG: LUD domain-containing protein [Bacteroidales bacterium]|nr:LUD domain-containing protein [Bacteroidales bacterium]MBN2755825.1 LUD domain-containing protein [Bacteroidales bacterium]